MVGERGTRMTRIWRIKGDKILVGLIEWVKKGTRMTRIWRIKKDKIWWV